MGTTAAPDGTRLRSEDGLNLRRLAELARTPPSAAALWTGHLLAWLSPGYRPEKHYMRGARADSDGQRSRP